MIVSHSYLKSFLAFSEKARKDLGDGDGVENQNDAVQRPVGKVGLPVPEVMIFP